MIRLYILAGFAFLFLQLHLNGNLNKYINLKYAYLSVAAIVLLAILFVFEFVRMNRKEREEKRAEARALVPHVQDGSHRGKNGPAPLDRNEHDDHAHRQGHLHTHHRDHGHTHTESSSLKRALGYAVLLFPIVTGIFLPVQTLDSSFVKAKGFSFPNLDVSADNPGYHQFLKPDTSVFYGKAGYKTVSQAELSEIASLNEVNLNDDNYLTDLEAIYNYPGQFADKPIGFNGFVYRGEQVDENHYFVFRFGFIHCVADSGVFGMLVEFPQGTVLQDDQWVHVSGKLTAEFYQPFKQTIPMLKTMSWTKIEEPPDPYVYRVF